MVKPINPFDLFTGGKQPELAIAYNLAHDNITKYINTLLTFNKPDYKPLEHINDLPDEVFVYLRHYLWKGNDENKNTSGYELDPQEKSIIKKLLTKLDELRNFYSHIWHDNYMMAFDKELYSFILNKHDVACSKLETKAADRELYFKQIEKYPLFKDYKYITQDGRVFLLSFFLNKGEMQSLLQRLKGYKRTNEPQYHFKHKLYTHYCHREGSSWDSTGIENKELEKRTNSEQTRILSGRQAYRIFNYLKDIPAFTLDEALPLILQSGTWVHNMDTLLVFIKEKNILPGFNFYKKFEVPENDETLDAKELNEANKLLEKKEREGYRYFTYSGDNNCEFEISYANLKHIVTDLFLDVNTGENNNQSQTHFLGVLKDCIDTRKFIFDSLKAGGNKPLHTENFKLEKRYSSIYINYKEYEDAIQERYYTGDEWRHIPISPTPKVEKLLIEWHAEFMRGTNDKPSKNEVAKRKKLLNLIRPRNEPFDTSAYEGLLRTGKKKKLPEVTDPAPLLFHLSYYYRELDTKKRSEDRFLAWGVHYLIDMGLVPDWHFELEQLKYEQKLGDPESPYKFKKVTTWAKGITDNFRLYITDHHVNVGIQKDGVIYRLRIGEKTIKYLLFWHFKEKNKGDKSINGFLVEVCKDLAAIYTNKAEKISVSALHLLENFALPELLYKTKVAEESEKGRKSILYKEQVLKFFTRKKDWVDLQLKNLRTLSRNEKNAILLDAYRLFNFSETEGQKFLRKNEYEQMSVCHFMLNQEKFKVKGLIERTFKLKRRLPAEIINIIYSVVETDGENLDNLLVKILRNRKIFLKQKVDLLNNPGIKNKVIKNDIVDFFDIYIDDANLSAEELAIRNNVRHKTLETLPFSVHPALALKYFYPQQFAAQGFRKEGGNYINVFYELRKQSTRLAGILPLGNFREKETSKIFDNYTQLFSDDKLLKNHIKKWTGEINDIKVKDILLLLVAEDYLKKYDGKTAEEFTKIRGLNKNKLDELFASEVTVTPNIQAVRSELDEEHKNIIPTIIYFSLHMHQLDDYFFRSQKDNQIKLAMFYINWRHEELQAYKDHNGIVEKITAWPDGTKQKPLTMGNLVEARRVNAGHAAELVNYIFDYERGIINNYAKKAPNKQPQQVLQEYSNSNLNGKYIDFDTVLQWDNVNEADIKSDIKTMRVKCLHTLIPINGSHRQKTLPGTALAEALHIYKWLGNDRTAPNIYEQEE